MTKEKHSIIGVYSIVKVNISAKLIKYLNTAVCYICSKGSFFVVITRIHKSIRENKGNICLFVLLCIKNLEFKCYKLTCLCRISSIQKNLEVDLVFICFGLRCLNQTVKGHILLIGHIVKQTVIINYVKGKTAKALVVIYAYCHFHFFARLCSFRCNSNINAARNNILLFPYRKQL